MSAIDEEVDRPNGDADPESAAIESLEEAARRARAVSHQVAYLSTEIKNQALHDIADSLLLDADVILEANETDVRRATDAGASDADLDRLLLTRARLGALAQGVIEVASQTDPVGESLRGSRQPNGLSVQEVRVPLGVVGLISEGRPNLTVDAMSLSLKAGNATVLLVDLSSVETCRALMEVVHGAAERQGIPQDAIQMVVSTSPGVMDRFMRMRRALDVLIPRGSPDLVRQVCSEATVPTIETGPGNCHVFVERTARLDMAADIAFNAKVSRPGASNSMETLLLDEPIAQSLLEILGPRFRAAGVQLRACSGCRRWIPDARPATEEDWSTEYLDLILAVKVVDGLEEAIRHIGAYGSHHSEAVVTQDYRVSRRFCERVDAAAVYVNASTRFTDGHELGLGAEMGVSTQKLHRRGPLGLRALTTWKWVVLGDGQVRD